MKVKLLSETGHLEAFAAMRLSRRSTGDSTDTVGPEDLKLARKLLIADDAESGDPHSVALRMIQYTFDITAPLYWWKQMDRYSVGKTQASDSTMYNIMSRALTADDFTPNVDSRSIEVLNIYIKNKMFQEVIENLPCGYLQRRIIQVSLPTLIRILHQRGSHKLAEWQEFRNALVRQTAYDELVFV